MRKALPEAKLTHVRAAESENIKPVASLHCTATIIKMEIAQLQEKFQYTLNIFFLESNGRC